MTQIKQTIEEKSNKKSGKFIGNKYNVNLKCLEKIITKNIGINVSNPSVTRKQNKILAPKDFNPEKSTIWSFKSRGSWATHNGNYRGNWSPYIPRNIILGYSNEGDLVLDYFCGSGTTAIECKLLNRNFSGIDINPYAVKLTKSNLNIGMSESLFFKSNIKVEVGDARNLNIDDNSIDLICAHPPYSDIINYTYNDPNDLSHLKTDNFLNEMDKVAKESYRVLKENKYCTILIGDMRQNKNVIPLGFWLTEKFTNCGFKLQELIIKRQHNCKTTGFWYKNSINYNFLLLAHEYLLVFKKEAASFKQDFSMDENFQYNNHFKENDIVIKKDFSLESKTVWVFNKENWFIDAISNLILRYSDSNYLIYKNQSICKPQKKKLNLIILQNENFIENNFNTLKESLNENGILAIICEDYRLENGLIYSPAIEIEKFLRENNDLKIKEIIVLALDDVNHLDEDKFLKINHKYILVYKKN
ncbi:MAG: DNA methyltransferase [Candidatus Humimicrobiaceae bacterium]